MAGSMKVSKAIEAGEKNIKMAELGTEKQKSTKTVLVAPDGGWGWVIVFGYTLSMVVVIPIMQSFGLLYKDAFEWLGMSATDAAVIINVNSAFGMTLGLVNGSLLKKFGYRKMAVAGSLLTFFGVTLTSFARTFVHFFVTYSLITSLGNGFLMASFSLAFNTYFKVKRGKAAGFAMTAIGLGPIFMPLVISALMEQYGVQGTALLLAGLSLHSLAGALLMQPVKWHMKRQEEPSPADEPDNEKSQLDISRYDADTDDEEQEPLRRRRRTITEGSSIDHDIDSQSIYGFETPLVEHRKSSGKRKSSAVSFRRSVSQNDDSLAAAAGNRRASQDPNLWVVAASAETVNLGSSVRIFDEWNLAPLQGAHRKTEHLDASKEPLEGVNNNSVRKVEVEALQSRISLASGPQKKKRNWLQRFGHWIVSIFDLGLLRDPIYVNLMMGMSLAVCAEINFSLMTPFILGDRGLDTESVAILMSSIAGTDIVFRFLTPYFADYFQLSARTMYMISMVMLIFCRTMLILADTYTYVLVVALGLGVSKGVRTVYMALVIPCYVPLERLASASGIQMLCNGILLLAQGPIVGIIRDVSGSYDMVIVVINAITFTTLLMWSTEIIIVWYRNRKRNATIEDTP